MKVYAKDIKPKTDYYLTYDYWPKGGTKIRYVGKIPAKEIWKGQRGYAIKLKDDEGIEYLIHPKSWVFGCDPERLK